jgi:hypothetical protein
MISAKERIDRIANLIVSGVSVRVVMAANTDAECAEIWNAVFAKIGERAADAADVADKGDRNVR